MLQLGVVHYEDLQHAGVNVGETGVVEVLRRTGAQVEELTEIIGLRREYAPRCLFSVLAPGCPAAAGAV
jgi:hypothetical protein